MSLCTCIFRKDERPPKKLHGEGTDIHTIPPQFRQPWTDFATTRMNRPKGRFFENKGKTEIEVATVETYTVMHVYTFIVFSFKECFKLP